MLALTTPLPVRAISVRMGQGPVLRERPFKAGMVCEDLLERDEHPAAVVWGRNGAPYGFGLTGARNPVAPGDSVLIITRPMGLGVGLGGLSGVTGLLSSAAGSVGSFVGGLVVPFAGAINNAISIALGLEALRYIGSLLVPSLPGRPVSSADTNQVYSWRGVTANYVVSGASIPILYGEMRLGLSIVSVDLVITQGEQGPESVLRMIGIVSEGPIEAIGQYTEDVDDLTGSSLPEGMQIEGNRAQDYDGVRCSIRLGSLEQSAAPGFESLRTIYPVNLPLLQGNSPSELELDWSFAQTFLMPRGTEADRAKFTIGFPGGLFRIGDQGGFKLREATFQVRATLVDEDDNEISAPIVYPSDDTNFTVKEKINSFFQQQFSVTLQNPDTFVPPEVGPAIDFQSSAREYGSIGIALWDAAAPFGFRDQDEPDEFTIWFVAKLNNLSTDPVFAFGDWDGSTSSPKVQGIVIRNENQGLDGTAPVVWIGGDVAVDADIVEGEADFDVSGYRSFAFVYTKVDPETTQPRLKIYQDGVLTADQALSAPMSWSLSGGALGPIWAAYPGLTGSGSSSNFLDGTMDEFVIYRDAKTDLDINQLHLNGQWVSREGDDNVILGARFDAITQPVGSDVVTVDYGEVVDTFPSLVIDLPRGASVESNGGVLVSQQQNIPLRGRYKFEVQRTSVDSDKSKKIDNSDWDAVTIEVDEEISYAGLAYLALEMKATDQLQGSRPNVTCLVKGRKVKVWDGVDALNPTFSTEYSEAPAWQALDLITTRNGLGNFFGIENVRLPEFLAWSQFTQAQVYDQLGKRSITRLEFVDDGDGTFSVRARCAAPIPNHWSVGSKVKLRNVVPAAFPFADQESVIEELIEVDSENTDVRVSVPAIANLIDDPNAFDAWSFSGTAPTIDVVDTPDHIPTFTTAAVAELVTFDTGLSLLAKNYAGFVVDALYTVSVYLKIVDGLGDITGYRFDIGVNTEQFSVPDDGEWHRVSMVIPAPSTGSNQVRFGNQTGANPARQLAVAGFGLYAGSVIQPFDELPSGAVTPGNLYADSMETGASSWVASATVPATIPPTLLVRDAEKAPGIPGSLEKWRVEESDTNIFQTATAGGFTVTPASDYATSATFRVEDGRGPVAVVLVVGGAESAELVIPDDGEFHSLGAVVSAGGDDTLNGVRFKGIAAQRTLLVGAMFLEQSSTLAGYDGGDSLGELFATEERLPTAIFFGDRGLGAWDALLQLMGAGRASPSRFGDSLGVRFDAPREPMFVFSPANTKAGTIRRSVAGRTTVNSITGEIQDRTIDYERNPIPRDHPSLEAPDAQLTTVLRTEITDMRGITSPTVAVREIDRRLDSAHDNREVIEWEGFADAAGLSPGDVVILAEPTARSVGGAKIWMTQADGLQIQTDADMVLHSRNLLAWSNDFTADDWIREGDTQPDEPVVTSNADAEPAQFGGYTLADQVLFPGNGANSKVTQSQHAMPALTVMTATVWVKHVAGALDSLNVRIKTSAETIAVASPTLVTGEWTKIVVSGTQTLAAAEVVFELEQDNTDASPLTLLVARARMIRGADDGEEPINLEATKALPRLFCTVRSVTTDAVSVRELKNRSGFYPAASSLDLKTGLDFVAQVGDIFTAGPIDDLRVELTSVGVSFDLGTKFSGIRYLDNYRDPDDYEDDEFESPTGSPGQQSVLAGQATSPTALPGQIQNLRVFEEAERDAGSGIQREAIVVTFGHDLSLAQRIDHTLIWARDENDAAPGPWELVGRTERGRTSIRVPLSLFPATRGETFRVAVQPVTPSGLRRGLDRCVSRTYTVQGYFPTPPKPSGASIVLNGTTAIYQVDDPAEGSQGTAIDVVRGGIIVNSDVGRLPPGARAFGPTEDWCQLPTSADGRGNVRVLFRSSGGDGARGSFVEVTDDLDMEGWPSPAAEGSWEDGPWSTDGTLSAELEEVDPEPAWKGGWKEIRFTDASTALEADWYSDAIDIGRPRMVHVSAAFLGTQSHPQTFENYPALDLPRGQRWSFEGPIDRADPLHDEVSVRLEYSYSDSAADPGTSSWRRFKPGTVYARSFRFRLVIERPDATYNLRISRGAFAIRALPEEDDVDGGRVTSI